MTFILTLSGVLSTASLLGLVFVLARLSQRLGEVTRMKRYYRHYYIAMIFLGIGIITHIIVAGATLQPDKIPALLQDHSFLLISYHLPLAIGITISFITTWRYWSWLFTEK